MIIDNSQIQLHAEHHKSESLSYSASYKAFSTQLDSAQQRLQPHTQQRDKMPPGQLVKQLTPAAGKGTDKFINPPNFELLSGNQTNRFRLVPSTESLQPLSSPKDRGMSLISASLRLFQSLFQTLIGQVHPISQLRQAMPVVSGSNPPLAAELKQSPTTMARSTKALAIDLQVNQLYKEHECTQFSACGVVNTRDGRQLDFNLNLQMSRSFESSTQLDAQQLMLKDPLVINFDGHSSELSDDKFEFDIEADGELEWIHFVDAHSGLLALDRNQDGSINDGSELFGTRSGNGFKDLAQHDQDGNGFIDEADTIFDQLRIWTKRDGEDRLETLKERDIGALYLGATDTPFELKNSDNQLQAKVQRSGVYLNESGGVGTMQQLDLVV